MSGIPTVKKNYEFARIYKRGKFYVAKRMTLYVYPNRTGVTRLGLSVSKKVGKAVKRNLFRRRMKESIFCYQDGLKAGIDLVFVARKCEEIPGFHEIKKEMKFLLKKLNAYEENSYSDH